MNPYLVVEEKKWLITVNREHAKIFNVKDGALKIVFIFENPKGGLMNRDLKTDRTGMNRTNFAGRRSLHALTGGKEPSVHVEEVFAAFLAEKLSEQIVKSSVTEVTITAEPKMCGILKGEMSTRKLPIAIEWLHKDLGNLSNLQIEKIMTKETARKDREYET